MAVRLFDALKLETQSLRSTIQEAIVSLAAAYKVCYFNIISISYHFILNFGPYGFILFFAFFWWLTMSVLVFVSLGLPREYSQRLGGASASKFSGGKYIYIFLSLFLCIISR